MTEMGIRKWGGASNWEESGKSILKETEGQIGPRLPDRLKESYYFIK